MKTKNNVQKNVFRFFAVVVTFVLISFTVSAQNFWKVLLVNSSFNEIALALTGGSNSEGTTEGAAEANVAFLTEDADASLELQAWMLKADMVDRSSGSVQNEGDEIMGLVGQMFEEEELLVDTDQEDAQVIEAWMMNEQTWEL